MKEAVQNELTYGLRQWIWHAYDAGRIDDLDQSLLLDIANELEDEVHASYAKLPQDEDGKAYHPGDEIVVLCDDGVSREETVNAMEFVYDTWFINQESLEQISRKHENGKLSPEESVHILARMLCRIDDAIEYGRPLGWVGIKNVINLLLADGVECATCDHYKDGECSVDPHFKVVRGAHGLCDLWDGSEHIGDGDRR